ncbi:MAG: N-6 DNA methylase [Pirellulales bacterium]|nr:N-6 DNA methylase [Pirellulales bacterium]
MASHDSESVCGRWIAEHFGSRSAVARAAIENLRKSPDVAAMEAYYAAVVRLVVDRVLQIEGILSKNTSPFLNTATVSAFSECPRQTGERWRELAQRELADLDADGRLQAPAAVVDWFGPFYQDLFPRTLRHALGEYYTPDWLAQHVLDVVGYLGSDFQGRRQEGLGIEGVRLLDPTCGSGVFLLAAIRRIRAAAGPKIMPRELGRSILNHVVGFDVNPLAVLTARANYLLAIRDLLGVEPADVALPVYSRDVILDAPALGETFDYVVGNPPWVAWDNLSDDYRARTKPLWQHYGLFSLTAAQARHGGGKKDLSMLVLYRAADGYLRRGGRLGFVITQTLFQTKGAGDGFRRFRLGPEGEPLGIRRVDDLTAAGPFAGAANWTATVALEKGRPTEYPVEYVRWLPAFEEVEGQGRGWDAHGAARFTRTACRARPIDPARPSSPWIVVPEGLERDLAPLVGPSDYTANLGANSGGANGVYWLEAAGPAGSGLATVRNLAGSGKHTVEPVETQIEIELLYPLVRWRDLRRWRAAPSACVLLVQDVESRSGIDEAAMRARWPRTLEYLARFRELLERRAAYRRYQAAGPYWSMYNVGPYTLAPTKVVWRRMDRRVNAAVVEPVDDPTLGRRPVVVQETCVQVAVDSVDDAHYLAAVLNSAVVNLLVAAHSVRGGKGFGTPSMLDYLNIRRYDPADSRHARLAELSREAHRQAAAERDTADVQTKIDRQAAELWELSPGGTDGTPCKGAMDRVTTSST